MAVQNINAPKLPRPVQAILSGMSACDISNLVRHTHGAHLSEMLDAAQDVAKQSVFPEMQVAAQVILDAAAEYHPGYLNPLLPKR